MTGMAENVTTNDISFEPAPAAGHRTYQEYVARALRIFERTREAFYKINPLDQAIIEAGDRWREASVSLMRWGESLYMKRNGTQEDKNYALELMNIAAKGSADCCDQISLHYDMLESEHPELIKDLLASEKAELKHLDVLRRMLDTQAKFVIAAAEGYDFTRYEQEMNEKVSREVPETYSAIFVK